MRLAASPRARESAVALRGPQAAAASPSLRPRGTRASCSLRATSSPANCDVVAVRGRSRVEAVRAAAAFDPPPRGVRDGGALATQRRMPAKHSADRQATVVAVPMQVAPLRAVAVGSASAASEPLVAESGAQGSSVTSAQKSARIEQMSAVAQSLQAAAMALQRAATVNPAAGASVAAKGAGTRETTAARLAGAAQRVRADWTGGGGMLSQLSRENAALREALNDTTRKLNALEGEKMRLAGGLDVEGSPPDAATPAAKPGSAARASAEAAAPAGADGGRATEDAAEGGAAEDGAAAAHEPATDATMGAATPGDAIRAQALQAATALQATAVTQAAQAAEARAALVEAVSAAAPMVDKLQE